MYTLFLYDDNTAVGQQSTREEKTGHMASFYTRSLWDVPRSERHIVVMMKFCCKKSSSLDGMREKPRYSSEIGKGRGE